MFLAASYRAVIQFPRLFHPSIPLINKERSNSHILAKPNTQKNRETAEDGGRLAMAETEHPLLLKDESFSVGGENQLAKKTWVETKKLWNIVGPAIFSRVTSYSMLVITQAFAGHLGDLELAGISIANNVLLGFDVGLLIKFPHLILISLQNPILRKNRETAEDGGGGRLAMAETEHPLLLKDESFSDGGENQLAKKTWVETKKLWNIVGPAIFSRVTSYSMLVITQAFAGHLGDLELAGISIANNVIVGFDFGLLLGMASALETLCGQAYGAKKYYMLGVYMQRSWIVLFLCCILLLPLYLFASPFLKLMGQPDDVAEVSGIAAMCMIPLHFSFAFQFPLQRFLQSQLKNQVIAWMSLVALIVHIAVSWLFVYQLQLGVIGTAMTLNFSWWVLVFGCFGYTVWGGCPLTWTGFSMEAFVGLWDFTKLSAASGVMLCMTINGWEMMIPLAFFAGIGVRVANELGAGNGKGAKFATIVAVVQSMIIGFFFWLLIILYNDQIGWIFTNSEPVLTAVNQLCILLAFTVLLNSIQPVLSGVAVGSGWQKYVAYINLGCYYLIGVPLGFVMGWGFDLGVKGIWAGMIFGGTAIQTVILAIITIRCDWDKEADKAKLHVTKWSEVH
ncbi:Protein DETOXIFICATION 27 [Linum perenne]